MHLASSGGSVGSWSRAWVCERVRVGGIFKAGDGVPFTATIGGDLWVRKAAKRLTIQIALPDATPINRNFQNARPTYVNANCFAFPDAPESGFLERQLRTQPPKVRGALPAGSEMFNLRGIWRTLWPGRSDGV